MHAVISSIRSGLLYSNVIVTAAAAMMAFRSFRLAGETPDPAVISLITAATLAVYAWHSIAPDERPGSARDRWNRKAKNFHRSSLAVSMIVLIFIFWTMPDRWLILMPAVLLTGYYMSAGTLQYPIHGKTVVLALTWTDATMIMPVWLAAQDIRWMNILPSSLTEFFYIYLICLFFDHRDASVDRPRHWSIRTPVRVRVVMLLTTIAFGMAGAWAWMTGMPRPWLMVKSILMLILILTSGYSLRTRSDGWYYGVLDSMMAVDMVCLLFMPGD